jgi:hypothetical protein
LSENIIFKGRIASDSKLPAKILYAFEIRIQRWLGECLKVQDRSMVNDRLVCFDEVFKMVMKSTINVTLPPNFVKPAPKSPPTSTGAASAEGNRKNKGGKKRKSGEINGECIVKNPAPISKFLMKDGKIGRSILPASAPRIVPSGTTPHSCVPAGTSVANALSTATTKQVTSERPPSLKQRKTIFLPTSPKFAGRINPPPRLDFPGRGPAQRKASQQTPTPPMDDNFPSFTDRPYQHSHHQSYLPQQ